MFRFAAMSAGLTAALMIAEVTLRVAGWPAPGFYVQGAGPIELSLPGKNGGAFPPGARGELRHYDYSVTCAVNRYGFRDRELTARRPDEQRIGILGDSFTVGIGVDETQRFANLFAAQLHDQKANTTVWNLGAPNCGTGCESDMLESVKHDYDLDEVVLAFYAGNDLQDNEAWLMSQTASPQNNIPRFASGRSWLRKHSRLASFLWVNGIRAWSSFEPEGIYTARSFDHYWPTTERTLNRLRQIVPAGSLTILYLPARPEWDDLAWQDARKRMTPTGADRFLTKSAVSRWATNHAVRFVDATPWLRACQPAAQCLFATDPHWTDAGHRLVAKGLLDYWMRER
ncbi:MAG TPA: GDSL-type esterase/lipase family protein [Pyrinomonadaceae bacterium]|nr:GDSL-type esterase/lipase family protein [Pyrinomonadaceae bacterium]